MYPGVIADNQSHHILVSNRYFETEYGTDASDFHRRENTVNPLGRFALVYRVYRGPSPVYDTG